MRRRSRPYSSMDRISGFEPEDGSSILSGGTPSLKLRRCEAQKKYTDLIRYIFKIYFIYYSYSIFPVIKSRYVSFLHPNPHAQNKLLLYHCELVLHYL